MKILLDPREVFRTAEPFIESVRKFEKSEALLFKDIGFLMAYRIFLSSVKLECQENAEVCSFLDDKSKEILTVIDSAMEKLRKMTEGK